MRVDALLTQQHLPERRACYVPSLSGTALYAVQRPVVTQSYDGSVA